MDWHGRAVSNALNMFLKPQTLEAIHDSWSLSQKPYRQRPKPGDPPTDGS